MTFDDYQGLARRTQNPELTINSRVLHALHGHAAEVGEIHSLYQKVYQGHSFDVGHLMKECGDLMWFLAELCDAEGMSLDEVATLNIEKLKARYPAGFSEDKSLHRKEGDV